MTPPSSLLTMLLIKSSAALQHLALTSLFSKDSSELYLESMSRAASTAVKGGAPGVSSLGTEATRFVSGQRSRTISRHATLR
jgi:hypothetical protein